MAKVITVLTSDREQVKNLLGQLAVPKSDSHKGQNGRILVIGGSGLFHSPPQWAAEAASHFADMVHVATSYENVRIMTEIKKKFRNGIIVPFKQIDSYVREDDVILVGSGLMRGDTEEGRYTAHLTRHLLTSYPGKKFVLDAGSLQTLDLAWLKNMEVAPILTPHQLEFEKLFGISIIKNTKDAKIVKAQEMAVAHRAVIMLKAIYDIVTDGATTYVVEGGNAGLTKGGTGDLLAGLAAALYAGNDPLLACASASCLLKATADNLYKKSGYWYNMDDILAGLPQTAATYLI